MHEYAIYLRKSRTDEQSELRGEGDALSRHYKTLCELADRMGYKVGKVYREIASADGIAHRPEMLQLLDDVQAGRWTGVLTMDIDRLGRGDSADQSVILTTFAYSNTLIITPSKVYDLNNDNDQDQGEFKLMFARWEHRTIKRRLYTGRERSAKDGWYLGTKQPYGYRKIKTTGPTLEIIPEQAEFVRLAFTWYADGLGKNTICDKLNAMGSRTSAGNLWTPSPLYTVLTNPLYIGKIRWGKRTQKVVYIAGQKVIKRPINPKMIISEGKHPAIISESLWEAVQARLQGNPAPSIKTGQAVSNPLCGLVKCKLCGKTMQRHISASKGSTGKRSEVLRCPTRDCKQYSIRIDALEAVLLDQLRGLTVEPVDLPDAQKERDEARRAAAANTRREIEKAEAQQKAAFDFLEQGIYSLDEFRGRKETLSQRLVELYRRLEEYNAPDPEVERLAAVRQLVPRARSVLESYSRAATPADKNELLKAVFHHVEYNRTARSYRGSDPTEGLEITLFPLLSLD